MKAAALLHPARSCQVGLSLPGGASTRRLGTPVAPATTGEDSRTLSRNEQEGRRGLDALHRNALAAGSSIFHSEVQAQPIEGYTKVRQVRSIPICVFEHHVLQAFLGVGDSRLTLLWA